ncbi:glycoside hydrolase superfamily [Xylariaceae sp. FL1019]|nr:glycoside hydrolase superfamily [Xylariaceae sp. FL1019]
MCGRYSEGGDLPCGMNLCCSYYGWCGTTENHCGNPDPNGLSPCQEGYGLCQIIPPPSCGQGSGSTDGRKIGYYQASNTRTRLCNKVSPSQLVTDGFTHLNFAFVKFNPSSYVIELSDEADASLITEFTALKSRGLQTWVAVGGFDFSDPGPTRTAWSDMASTQAGRATFISSLKAFMAKYGFQGVDIDWEYPATPERGGKRADTQNLVDLVREMRSSFGSDYGISMALAPDYWYLRGFDGKAMEASVDFFGFMAYDLHGSWDADVKTLGSIVRAQTDIRDIGNDTTPLWFDGLDPAKINFGTAYYGRGYTLADPSCTDLLCPFSGPSKAAPCTDFAGVMSLREIQQKIDKDGLTPQLLPEAMVKQLVFEDQWIGYDDDETIAMKKSWADGLCFGGTMVWSIDFDSSTAGSGDEPPTTTDGTCGVQAGGVICGDFENGDCCSSSGYCGSGPAYCSNGCQRLRDVLWQLE